MSDNVNEALIRRYYTEFANEYSDARVAQVIGEVLTDDFVFPAPNNVEGSAGAERHRQFLVWHHRALVDQHFSIDGVVASDDLGAARWTLTGIYSEAIFGIPAGAELVT